MFFPLAYLSKKSCLSKIYIHSCTRAPIPMNLLSKCIDAFYNEKLSLRLWSRLSLTLTRAILLHYKNIHLEVLRIFKVNRRSIEKKQRYLSSAYITLPIIPALFIVLRDEQFPYAPEESVEYPRMHSSSLMLQQTAFPHMQNIPVISSIPRNKRKTDKSTRIPEDSITHRDILVRRRTQISTIIGRAIDTLEEEVYEHSTISELDISSIEAPRREEIKCHPPEAWASRSSSFSFEQHSLTDSQILGVENQNIQEFLSVLIAVTEGKISAKQDVPYGEIVCLATV
ncbi:hypothetical protein NEFER03_0269 [Nematocida sp. LUAm3]|nr:hypothetical protein NEFER03_0269 [Nematocida sp. LUAm3]KAI5173722.1 hypothetical protein NEFER02_0238 [Nematocida sp. LUAm2]KAI5176944.1 hypothetical protein NEFER01_0269 [Nematocida sp. LUAm1]